MGFKDIVKTVKSEAGDAVEVTKLKAKISREKTNIKDSYEKIGELIYNRYPDGGMDEEIDAVIAQINASKQQINSFNDEISRVKMD